MFSLLYGLWEYIFRKVEFRILILGVDKSGKTTLLERIKTIYTEAEGLSPDKILPTVGLNIGRVEACNAKLVFWDLGGQAGLRSIWEKYYAEAHAILYVVDASEESRFEEAKQAFHRAISSQDLDEAPVVVIANKQDHTQVAELAVVEKALGTQKANRPTRPCRTQKVSATNGDGVEDAVSWLVDAMKRSRRTHLLAQQIQ
ncbi:hypothetical protein CYMTET_12370 [Cymbomonas tetramitiformis]|uniref:ADP-ribosylation factor-related protein 1 n=1 Tax=Cymbomonas tetramitiformis TaxID=36881 RepID=A0AAE0GKJ4_9CHLO|nr:hypothetical protein CYMTET_12370 [Cymbomonas tetramitiformis]